MFKFREMQGIAY